MLDWEAFFSIVFPVMPFFAAIAIVAPISLLINGRTARAITPTAFFLAFVGWVVIPAVGLLAGGLPMEKFLVQRLGSRRILGD